jgi:hypothetical protein
LTPVATRINMKITSVRRGVRTQKITTSPAEMK